jgi:hypothetical protein
MHAAGAVEDALARKVAGAGLHGKRNLDTMDGEIHVQGDLRGNALALANQAALFCEAA